MVAQGDRAVAARGGLRSSSPARSRVSWSKWRSSMSCGRGSQASRSQRGSCGLSPAGQGPAKPPELAPDTLAARGNLSASYRLAGRTGEAIAIEERVAAARERVLGPEHPDTLTARGNLSASYRLAGRTGEAIAIEERVAAARERVLGPEHPDTLTARGNLSASYRLAGRTGEAIAIEERVAAARERVLGPEHPDTLTARANLAMAKTEEKPQET